jgi:hypothetical protein
MNGWALVILFILILEGGKTRIDCALGVQSACTEISKRYPIVTDRPLQIDTEKALTKE